MDNKFYCFGLISRQNKHLQVLHVQKPPFKHFTIICEKKIIQTQIIKKKKIHDRDAHIREYKKNRNNPRNPYTIF